MSGKSSSLGRLIGCGCGEGVDDNVEMFSCSGDVIIERKIDDCEVVVLVVDGEEVWEAGTTITPIC